MNREAAFDNFRPNHVPLPSLNSKWPFYEGINLVAYRGINFNWIIKFISTLDATPLGLDL